MQITRILPIALLLIVSLSSDARANQPLAPDREAATVAAYLAAHPYASATELAEVRAAERGELEARHVTVFLQGVRPLHERTLAAVGAVGRLAHERHLFTELDDALSHAHEHAHRVAEAAR